MNKRILCMGSLNIDLTMNMSKLPAPGETVMTDNFNTFPGGKGGNQAATIASLGGNVSFFTKMGNDSFSSFLLDEQKKRGSDVSAVEIIPGQTAGIAMIRVDEKGQNSISFTPGANSLMSPEDVERRKDLFETHDILLTSMEIGKETVYAAIKMAKSHNMTVVLDPAPAPEGGIPEEILRLCDYAKPNETEAEILTGIRADSTAGANAALNCLRAKGIAHPVITLGQAGLVSFDDSGNPVLLPALQVSTVDSTAAGDVFIGAFTTALAEGGSLRDCLLFARAASALSTTKHGAQSSIPTRSEIQRAL